MRVETKFLKFMLYVRTKLSQSLIRARRLVDNFRDETIKKKIIFEHLGNYDFLFIFLKNIFFIWKMEKEKRANVPKYFVCGSCKAVWKRFEGNL